MKWIVATIGSIILLSLFFGYYQIIYGLITSEKSSLQSDDLLLISLGGMFIIHLISEKK